MFVSREVRTRNLESEEWINKATQLENSSECSITSRCCRTSIVCAEAKIHDRNCATLNDKSIH